MGIRPIELVEGEWYHCYSRTVDRKNSFVDGADYQRFIESMYLANSTITINRSAFKHFSHERILAIERDKPLVAFGAYALMPNHFHFLVRQEMPDGISKFMHRMGTSYSMYFNLRNKRIGNLFVRPFRARHVDTDAYLQKVSTYIHLNPLDVVAPNWERRAPNDLNEAYERLVEYPYSSLRDYTSEIPRPETALLARLEDLPIVQPDKEQLKNLLADVATYHDEIDF